VVELVPVEPLPELGEEVTRPWLNPLVYEREKTGHALLQTDFRPCVALFVRFVGIDYEADTAAEQLDQFIRPLQAILAQYEGILIDLIFGDKGSYAYINFGALSVHEDDARRAAKTALHLREVARQLPFLEPLQVGITRGVVRTGAYGGAHRRHYGALGDEVNVAARLMSTAVADQILVSSRIYEQLRPTFRFGAEQQLHLKGKREPITVFPLYDEQAQTQRPIHLPEPSYNSPMIGREAEQELLIAKLTLAQQGASQIVALIGDAGLGKSRLALQTVLLAFRRGFTSYAGACQADGLNSPYLVWKQIWRSFFGLEPHQPPAQQIAQVTASLHQYAPERAEALPLLGPLLDLPIPETNWTTQLEPKSRRSALHALLETCLRRASAESPLLLVVEDLHWIDALSHDLLVELAQTLQDCPIFFLLVYRPSQLARLQAPRLEARPNYTPLHLSALNEREARQLIERKLSQLYPNQASGVAPALVQALLARAEGNPFYLEELLNFLHGRGLDPRQITSWETELPESLHALILSRLDQLTASQKRTMRVASVIGRLFPLSWLIGYYPALGDLPQVQADLADLHNLDLTLLDSTEPELVYLFKHIITHEVTYESLPFATRTRLHEQLAHYLEEIHAPLDSIAYHYGQSDNRAKQIEYYRKAAEAAAKSYANQAALDYYDRLLPLLADDPEEQRLVRIAQGTIYGMMADYDAAEGAFTAALALAEASGDEQAIAEGYHHIGSVWAMRSMPEAYAWFDKAEGLFTAVDNPHWLAQTYTKRANLLVRQGRYAEAEERINQAFAIATHREDTSLQARLLSLRGTMLFFQGDYAGALRVEEQALPLLQALDDKFALTMLLGNMGQVYSVQGDFAQARYFYEQSLALAQMIGDKQRLVNVLANLGLLLYEQGDWLEAQTLQEQSLALAEQIGNQYAICITLINLGNIALAQRDAPLAWRRYSHALQVAQAMGDQNNIFYTLSGLAATAVLEQNLPRATRLAASAETLRLSLGTAWDVIEGRIYEETLAAARAGLGEEAFAALWGEGVQMDVDTAVAYALAE
jgi:adenylate cyclase